MHIGTTLLSGAVAFSPWFPRQADNAIFTVETIESFGGVTLTVDVFTKNTEETGPGTQVGASISWNTVDSNSAFQAAQFLVGVTSFDGFDEMVRFKFSASSETVQLPVVNEEVTFDASNQMWLRYRMLMPTWFDTAVV